MGISTLIKTFHPLKAQSLLVANCLCPAHSIDPRQQHPPPQHCHKTNPPSYPASRCSWNTVHKPNDCPHTSATSNRIASAAQQMNQVPRPRPLYTAPMQMSHSQICALSSVFTISNLAHVGPGRHSAQCPLQKPKKMVQTVYCHTQPTRISFIPTPST